MGYMFVWWSLLMAGGLLRPATSAAELWYPYLGKNGLYGYADGEFRVHIAPQYKRADFFTKQGFALVTDTTNKMGIIDKNNKPVVPIAQEHIVLHELSDFTLAEIRTPYSANYRFWDWEFLPGFDIIGGGSNDKRLFDTHVQRKRITVYLLGDRPLQITSATFSASAYNSNYLHVVPLADNQILIEGKVYALRKNGSRVVATNIDDILPDGTFAQRKGEVLRIVDRQGEQTVNSKYVLLDTITFQVNGVPLSNRLAKGRGKRAVYSDQKGRRFVYPDFTKSLPRVILNKSEGELTTEEVLQKSTLIASVAKSDYFVFMGKTDGKRFFWFLDGAGNWHSTLPSAISFIVTTPAGEILWPEHDYYITSDKLPAGWSIREIRALTDKALFRITLTAADGTRQGIWNLDKKQWVIAPEYYKVQPLGNDFRQWAFQADKDGFWGVLDAVGELQLAPKYASISSHGQVRLEEQGKTHTFFLQLPSLKEFREK